MPRIARIVIAGVAHHITQRGNNRQDVFFVDDDRHMYLDLLHIQCQRYGLSVTGYCLMNNHVHIIGTPEAEGALAKAIGRTHFLYTQYINRMHNRSGHLWQNRFYSCPMDEAHALHAICYAELNPVRAGMKKMETAPDTQSETVLSVCDYPWSSAAAHCGSATHHPVLDMEQWRTRMPPSVWREILCQFHDDDIVKVLRQNTHKGRPLGSDSFLSKLEQFAGRRLRPLPVGRPKGSKNSKQSKRKDEKQIKVAVPIYPITHPMGVEPLAKAKKNPAHVMQKQFMTDGRSTA